MSVAATTTESAANGPTGKQLSLAAQVDWFIAPLASQKIAVAMFAYGIFVILVGTLAQVNADIWQVVPLYFRTWIMHVDINVFFPLSFFPEWKRLNVPPIPLPGGMFVGVTMILNMLFAHARWVLQLKTKTSLVLGGVGLIAFGWLITLLLILAGHNSSGFQTNPPFSWTQFWTAMQVSLIGVWVTAVFCYFWFALQPIFRSSNVTMLRIVAAAVGGFFLAALSVGVWYMLFVMSNPGPEGLRIAWQLLKGTFAGVILLPGCWLLFQKRGGIVLLHQGMLLLMLNELFVARYAAEYNIALSEGQTANYLRDIRTVELALIDRSGKEQDEHFVVPMQMLLDNAKVNEAALKDGVVDAKQLKPLADPKDALPVQLTVLRYVRNADLRKLKEGEKPLATKGVGLRETILERAAAKGTDSDGAVDLGAIYVQVKEKKTGADLGTFLVSQAITEGDDPDKYEKIETSGNSYLAALRFKRQFVPFTVQLKDVSKDDYVASNTPKNYSSDVRLKDPTNGVDSTVHIKMNDPLRYSGLTLYQSNWGVSPGGIEHSTLAVVQNVGWMIPYVALMIITVGMIAHFLSTLTRFLRRRENEEIASGDIVVAEVVQPQTTKQANQPANQRKGKPTEIRPLLNVPGIKRPREINWGGLGLGVAASFVIFALFLGMALRNKSPKTPTLNYEAFNTLPVAGNGRVMPYGSLAANMLLQLRQRETAKTREGVTIPASQWFLDLICGLPSTASHRVFKIDNPEVQKVFELDEHRQGHVYSTAELFPKIQEFEKQVRAARQKPKEELSVTQKKLLLMDGQLSQYMTLVHAFQRPRLPPLPEQGDSPETVQRKILALKQAMVDAKDMLDQAKLPLAIPLPNTNPEKKTETDWQAFPIAYIVWVVQTELQNQEGDAATGGFVNIVRSYAQHAIQRDAWQAAKLEQTELGSKKGIATRKKRLEEDLALLKRSGEQRGVEEEMKEIKKEIDDLDDAAFVSKRLKDLPGEVKDLEKKQSESIEPFNLAVSRYNTAVERTHPPEYNRRKLDLEVWMNRVSPFYVGMQLYIVAFLLATFGWLIPSRSCNWAAFTLVVLTFVLHTTALVLRIYISGRPPVTNLYSSAVFIGWFAVMVGMIIELVFRIGLGNLVSTTAGFATLIIAYFLGMSGDTIGVMQAVLDTQFWLATHVVSITVGYAATFAAGFLGVLYVLLGVCTPGLNADFRKICTRMIYGIVCFAMFFSFVGTVLGGLWADDSWGRFWGWDPKENGALIIVLWNALILHAKWDKMVGERGLALLAIGGNIVTAWSWFGVNELGVGLHSYGFTDGVLRALLIFVATQIALIVIGAALPQHLWWSVQAEEGLRGAKPAKA